MPDLPSLLDLAVSLAERAGALLVDGVAQVGEDVEVTTKTSRTDMVTEMDRASEALIVDGILQARPHDAIVAEEGSSAVGTTGVRWIVDPLDGTTNYLYRHPAWAVSIAVEVDGNPAVGVVTDPSCHETFTAMVGAGAFLNGEPISVSRCRDLSTALVATGFGYSAEQRSRQAVVAARVLPAVRDIRRRGSAALDLCWAACGRLDAYYEAGLQPWDLAAGVIVAAEAGAVVCGFDGGPASSESVLAAPPGLVAPLLALLDPSGPGRL